MPTWKHQFETLATEHAAAINLWRYATTDEELAAASKRVKESLTRMTAFFDEHVAHDCPSLDSDMPF